MSLGKAMHWIASIYVCVLGTVAVIALLALLGWGAWAAAQHISDWGPWAFGISFVVFSFWASGKIQDDGMAWETDDHE